ncbi:MAG: T9SS type A sorting domain-containing protein [Bacteroidetes bacterium]|nr:T9SS type A sorting domain-containing protein [Bacteroidota bacterium]
MKKNYILFLLAAFIGFSAQAQVINSGINPMPVKNLIHKTGNPSAMTTDTLRPPSFGSPVMCDTAPVYYTLDSKAPNDTGYAFGNNVYGETMCAEKYYATGTVSEVLVWYGYKTGTTGSTSVKLYSIDATTKGPSATVLGTSAVVTTASVTLTPYTTYTFSASVSVTGSFAAAVVFPTTAGDTVAVVSTKLGCSTADSLSYEDFPTFGGWLNTKAAFGVNLDLYILPVGTLTLTTGVKNEYSTSGLSLLGAYPNPANEFTNIKYRVDAPATVSAVVFDLTGRVLFSSSENLSEGTHELKVPLKNLSAGNYYYTIRTDKGTLTSKFSVAK